MATLVLLVGFAPAASGDHVPPAPPAQPPIDDFGLLATLWSVAANVVHDAVTEGGGDTAVHPENAGKFAGAVSAEAGAEADAWTSEVQRTQNEVGDPNDRIAELVGWATTTGDGGLTRLEGTLAAAQTHGARVVFVLDEEGRLWLQLLDHQGGLLLHVLADEAADFADVVHLLRARPAGDPLADPADPNAWLDSPAAAYLQWKAERVLAALALALQGIGHQVDDNLNALGDPWETDECLRYTVQQRDDAGCVADAALHDAMTITNLVWDFDHDGLNIVDEFRWGTDPLDQDTDDDGWPDGLEAEYWTRAESTLITQIRACPDGSTHTCSWRHPDAYRDTDSDGCANTGGLLPACARGDADSDTSATTGAGDGIADGAERYGCANPWGENSAFTAIDQQRTTDPLGIYAWRPCGSAPGGDATRPDLADTDFDGVHDGGETVSTAYGDAGGYGTDPNDADTDGDAWPDGGEAAFYGRAWQNDAATDRDGDHGILDPDADRDGLLDGAEIGGAALATRPDAWDTDGDGLPDPWELAYALDPTRAAEDCRFVEPGLPAPDRDTDGDGLCDRAEYTVFSAGRDHFLEGPLPVAQTGDPTNADSDGDLLTDLQEVTGALNPAFRHHAFIPGLPGSTSPFLPDTDADGYADGDELLVRTDPNDAGLNQADTDNDGIADAIEARGWRIGVDDRWVLVSSDVGPQDTDGDGLLDGQEYFAGTDPRSPDTDGDGLDDVADAACDPAHADADGDGLADADEVTRLTGCLDPDTDLDGLTDGQEVEGWLVRRDLDGDGALEPAIRVTSDPALLDSDADGLDDGAERLGRTDPSDLDGDTDDDQQTDLAEFAGAVSLPELFNAAGAQAPASAPAGASPAVPWTSFIAPPRAETTGQADVPFSGGPHRAPVVEAPASWTFCVPWMQTGGDDPDCDLLPSAFEAARGTNPYRPDTDGDGLSDGAEVWNWHTDPLDPDTDRDGVPDGMDLRPLEEDLHPVIERIESGDYYTGFTVLLRDQSPVRLMDEHILFYDPDEGFECAESFSIQTTRRLVPLYGPGDVGYVIEFDINYVQNTMSYSTNDHYCGAEFVVLLPFRDAHGNTVQLELTSRASQVCVVDPLYMADLALAVVPVRSVLYTRRQAFTYHTSVFAAHAVEPDLKDMGKYVFNMGRATARDWSTGAVGVTKLTVLFATLAFLDIATGRYEHCEDRTTVDFGVYAGDQLGDPATTVTDVRGRTILFSEGLAERRDHAAGAQMGDQVRGAGQARAAAEGAGAASQAWITQTLQSPAADFAWPRDAVYPRYHIYCPRDGGAGFVKTSEPTEGNMHALFVTAWPAATGYVPDEYRDCPQPTPVLP